MSFEKAIAFTSYWEGGFVDHPKDPGGKTNLGITQKTLDAAKMLHPNTGIPDRVIDLKREQSEFIYQVMYYEEASCQHLRAGLDLAVFDAAVNAGAHRARIWMQKAARVKADGVIGAVTISAANSMEPNKFLREFHALRAFHYMLLDDIDDDFGLGWARRLMACHDAAQENLK